uniref:KRAB domain-containing protein n=1 Tax=Mus spicilegus TaxID=10103 RepID=A0A8C6GRZ2_MUSSI
MGAVTYDDVHMTFTGEEWDLLDPSQKSLCKGVMLASRRHERAAAPSFSHHGHSETEPGCTSQLGSWSFPPSLGQNAQI